VYEISANTLWYCRTVTIAQLLQSVVDGGTSSLILIALLPLTIGAVAWWLHKRGDTSASQKVANLGIALGVVAALVGACTVIWLSRAGGLGQLRIEWVLAPVYLLGAAIAAEHLVHPGQQAAIRGRIRSAAVLAMILGLAYWLLSNMRVYALIHSGFLGLLLFLGALVAIGYVMIRRVV
jgi:hypothetical protein